MMRSSSLLLLLALASCRGPASGPSVGPGPAPGSAATAPATAGTAATPSAAASLTLVQSLTAKMDDDGSVFGFAAYDGQWVIGTAFTDDRDTLALRPVQPQQLGPTLHTLSQSRATGYPIALVGETDPSRPPWVVSKADGEPWRYVARGFDGRGETTALTIPDDESGITRVDWRFDGRVTGAVAYRFEISRPLTAAERRAVLDAHERHDRSRKGSGSPKGSSVSARKALAHGMRYFGAGAKAPFEGVRMPEGGPTGLGWLAVATGELGWLGAHWEQRHEGDTIAETRIALHWFDPRSVHVRSTTVAAPHGTSSGQLALAGDGTAYLVADRSSPFDPGPALEVLAFDPAGTALPARTVPVLGWVADTMTSIACDGRTWLAFDAYAAGTGEEVIVALELVPRGELGTGTVLWSRRDPKPDGNGSRPGRVLYGACNRDREAAAAMQLWDIDAGHEIALASWRSGPAATVAPPQQ
jgi:hypothetical protein